MIGLGLASRACGHGEDVELYRWPVNAERACAGWQKATCENNPQSPTQNQCRWNCQDSGSIKDTLGKDQGGEKVSFSLRTVIQCRKAFDMGKPQFSPAAAVLRIAVPDEAKSAY